METGFKTGFYSEWQYGVPLRIWTPCRVPSGTKLEIYQAENRFAKNGKPQGVGLAGRGWKREASTPRISCSGEDYIESALRIFLLHDVV
jgi:hypothetical protein